MPSAWWYQQRLKRWLSWKTFRGPLKTLGLFMLLVFVVLGGICGWLWYQDEAGPRVPLPSAANLVVIAPMGDGLSVSLDGAPLPSGEVVQRKFSSGAHELLLKSQFGAPRTVKLTVGSTTETWLVTPQEQCFLVLNMREVAYSRAPKGQTASVDGLNPWGKRPDVVERIKVDGARMIRGDLAYTFDDLPQTLDTPAEPLLAQQIPCVLFDRTDKQILIDDMGFKPWSR